MVFLVISRARDEHSGARGQIVGHIPERMIWITLTCKMHLICFLFLSSAHRGQLSLIWLLFEKMPRFGVLWLLPLALISVVSAQQQWWLGAYKHIGKVAFQPDSTYPAFRNVLDYGCDSKSRRGASIQD